MAKFSRTFLIFWTNTKLLTNIWLQIQKSKIVAYKYSSLNHHWENITVNFFLLKRMNFIILLTFINYYKVLLLLYKGPLAKAFFGWSFIRHFFVSSTNRIFFGSTNLNKPENQIKRKKKCVQKPSNIYKYPKNSEKKKWYTLSFDILGHMSLTNSLQSMPFQNPGGGNLNNIDWQTSIYSPKYLCIIWD